MVDICHPSFEDTDVGGFWESLTTQARLLSELLAGVKPCLKIKKNVIIKGLLQM